MRPSRRINSNTHSMLEPNSVHPLVFLETTIQIDRIIGLQERRDAIRSNLDGKRACTSGHVLGEFNRTLIRDAIAFRDLVLSSSSVGEAVKRLNNYDRRYPRTINLLATLGFDGDRQNTIDRLEKFIDWQARDLFWEFIDRNASTDAVGCVLKDWLPERNEAGHYDSVALKCLKTNPPNCSIREFIDKNREIISDFIDKADQATEGNVQRAGKALGSILHGTDSPFGERSNCYWIADTMIVLESHPDAMVYSTDSDVVVICGILGRHSYEEDLPSSGD